MDEKLNVLIPVLAWCMIGWSSCWFIYREGGGEFLKYNPAFVAFLGFLGPVGLIIILTGKYLGRWKRK